jgi:diaminopimelate epimerase
VTKLPFVKYHGAGNDFVLMDLCRSTLHVDFAALARSICDRRFGIGADGLLLLFPSTVADFKMRIFNPDGTEPAMCGNGLRCLAHYVLKSRNIFSEVSVETRCGVFRCRGWEDQIAVRMGWPTKLFWSLPLEKYTVYVVDTGVPHAVIFVDRLDAVDVAAEGRFLRFHPRFSPEGANVNFVTVLQGDKLSLRTYERGVEGETLACGTGAAAAAFVAREVRRVPSPICVQTRSSETLRFLFFEEEMEMVGSAEEVFRGVYT